MEAVIIPALLFLALVLVLLVRAWRFGAASEALPPPDATVVDGEAAAARLAGALRFATVAPERPDPAAEAAFAAFHAFLAETFPQVHAALERETVGRFGLLYRWPGEDQGLRPLLLLAHQDVVPAASEGWRHPPFAGEVAAGFVWGRGALDDKGSLMGILEAVESLLREGFRPRRPVLLAFGHDEEIGGGEGAAAIARLLRERGVRPELVLDEGGFVASGVLPGVNRPVALVGVAEKGYVSLELTARGEGGHSSLPPSPTTVGILSRALLRLEEHPFPADLTFIRRLFAAIAPGLSRRPRLLFANLWLLRPWAVRALSRSPEMNAAIRTTVAPTLLAAGVRENVLPDRAAAVVNCRIMPGESVSRVVERVRKVVADPRVEVRERPVRSEPSPVTDADAACFRLLARTIRRTLGEGMLVAPYLVAGATDARYFHDLAVQVLRFSPLRIGAEDIKRVHGVDERLAVADYARAVRFYLQLLRHAGEL